MIDELLSVLEQMNVSDVKSATLDELEDVCKNPVFKLLCDVCEVLHPRKASNK